MENDICNIWMSKGLRSATYCKEATARPKRDPALRLTFARLFPPFHSVCGRLPETAPRSHFPSVCIWSTLAVRLQTITDNTEVLTLSVLSLYVFRVGQHFFPQRERKLVWQHQRFVTKQARGKSLLLKNVTLFRRWLLPISCIHGKSIKGDFR